MQKKNESKAVALAFDTQHLMQGLKASFAGKGSILGELLQNARRAGATRIDITTDGKTTLTIEDNGRGVQDFQNLLTIAGSSWEDDVQDEEPFGIGFLAALLNADTVTVESSGQQMTCDTAAVLDGKPVDVTPGPVTEGCRITLEGLGTHHNLWWLAETAVDHQVVGFSVPVYYNGNPMVQSAAIGSTFVKTEIGHIRLSPREYNGGVSAYLGGLKVESGSHRFGAAQVHLDPALFKGRFPDRSHLQNGEKSLHGIRQACDKLCRQKLCDLAVQLPGMEFFVRYEHSALSYAPGVLNNIDIAQAEWFYDIDLCKIRSDRDGLVHEQSEYLHRQDIEQHPVVVADEFDNMGTVIAGLVQALGGRILNNRVYAKLDDQHWLKRHAVCIGNEEVFDITAHEAVDVGEIDSDDGGTNVVACQSIEISHPKLGSATITDQAVYTGEREVRLHGLGNMDTDADEGEVALTLLMPRMDELAHQQLSDFRDSNDCYDEDYDASTQRTLMAMYQEAVGGDPKAVVQPFVATLSYTLPASCNGKRLTVDYVNGVARVVEVTDMPKAA